MEEPQSGEGCAVSAHGGDMSSRRWQQSRPRTNITVPHGDRGRPRQGVSARRTTRLRSGRRLPPPPLPPTPPRRLVPSTLRWTPGTTWETHQPPGGQHRCWRCGRRRDSGGTRGSASSLCSTPWCRSMGASWWKCRLSCLSQSSSSTLPSRSSWWCWASWRSAGSGLH